MLTWAELGPFLVAAVLICISPGPAFALILRTSALSGWRAAMPVLAGAEVGVVVWALLAALGVAGVVAASPAAFTAMKLVGALVLIALGVQAWRSSFRPHSEPALDRSAPAGFWRGLGTGLLTNLANPKLMVFCLAFFPQFIPAAAPPIPTTALLVSILVAIDVVWFTGLALAAAGAGQFFRRRRVRVAVDRLAGTVFLGLAARMATLAR